LFRRTVLGPISPTKGGAIRPKRIEALFIGAEPNLSQNSQMRQLHSSLPKCPGQECQGRESSSLPECGFLRSNDKQIACMAILKNFVDDVLLGDESRELFLQEN
jgi:hypothetical protein